MNYLLYTARDLEVGYDLLVSTLEKTTSSQENVLPFLPANSLQYNETGYREVIKSTVIVPKRLCGTFG